MSSLPKDCFSAWRCMPTYMFIPATPSARVMMDDPYCKRSSACMFYYRKIPFYRKIELLA